MDYSFKRLNNGDLVKGEVISVSSDYVELDVNSFASGIINKEDYSNSEEPLRKQVKVGDIVDAIVLKVVNGDEQVIYLTRKPLIKKENFNKLKELSESKESFIPKKVKENNGGYTYTYLGYELFMPKSQYVEGIKEVRIIEFKDNKIVISNKVIKQEIDNDLKNKEYDLIKVGEKLIGKVIQIMPYGVLVKFEHNVALVRNSQLSYDFIKDANEILKLNDEIEVLIIKKENGKIEASKKELLVSPFDNYVSNNSLGKTVKGIVKQKLPFGILIDLDKHVTGLLHESEYAWNPNSNFKDYIKLGDEIEIKIVKIDKSKQSISLSKKAIEDNPWSRVKAKKGDIVDLKVVNIVSGKGIEVTTLGIDAFVNVKELSMDKISKIEDYFNPGDDIKAVVVEINPEKWYISLSVKKYQEMLERQEFEKYMNKSNELEDLTIGYLFEDMK